MILYWVMLAGIILIGAYALINTGHYANRTPRQRTLLIVLFIVFCLGFLLGPDRIITSWDSFTETHQKLN